MMLPFLRWLLDVVLGMIVVSNPASGQILVCFAAGFNQGLSGVAVDKDYAGSNKKS